MDITNREESQGKKGIAISNVQIILHYYARALGKYKFKYNLVDWKWISLECVITNVTLTIRRIKFTPWIGVMLKTWMSMFPRVLCTSDIGEFIMGSVGGTVVKYALLPFILEFSCEL